MNKPILMRKHASINNGERVSHQIFLAFRYLYAAKEMIIEGNDTHINEQNLKCGKRSTVFTINSYDIENLNNIVTVAKEILTNEYAD